MLLSAPRVQDEIVPPSKHVHDRQTWLLVCRYNNKIYLPMKIVSFPLSELFLKLSMCTRNVFPITFIFQSALHLQFIDSFIFITRDVVWYFELSFLRGCSYFPVNTMFLLISIVGKIWDWWTKNTDNRNCNWKKTEVCWQHNPRGFDEILCCFLITLLGEKK